MCHPPPQLAGEEHQAVTERHGAQLRQGSRLGDAVPGKRQVIRIAGHHKNQIVDVVTQAKKRRFSPLKQRMGTQVEPCARAGAQAPQAEQQAVFQHKQGRENQTDGQCECHLTAQPRSRDMRRARASPQVPGRDHHAYQTQRHQQLKNGARQQSERQEQRTAGL